MTITSIILSHYKEREDNLKRIVDDLLSGTVKPDQIMVIIDNPKIKYEDKRVVIIKSNKTFMPIIRFSIGSICDTDYCFFIDDDLSVREKTLENFIKYADEDTILGLEGNILNQSINPYTTGETVNRGNYDKPKQVDIIIRTYFVPRVILAQSILLRADYPELPQKSVDDIFLCLSNKFGKQLVIPVNNETDVIELPEGGVGQCYSGEHYKNRDEVCKELMEKI